MRLIGSVVVILFVAACLVSIMAIVVGIMSMLGRFA